MSDDGVHYCLTAWDINRLCLLGISFFQKSAPELVLSERLCENQLVVAGGNAVVHDDINPLAITPELSVETTEKIIDDMAKYFYHTRKIARHPQHDLFIYQF